MPNSIRVPASTYFRVIGGHNSNFWKKKKKNSRQHEPERSASAAPPGGNFFLRLTLHFYMAENGGRGVSSTPEETSRLATKRGKATTCPVLGTRVPRNLRTGVMCVPRHARSPQQSLYSQYSLHNMNIPVCWSG